MADYERQRRQAGTTLAVIALVTLALTIGMQQTAMRRAFLLASDKTSAVARAFVVSKEPPQTVHPTRNSTETRYPLVYFYEAPDASGKRTTFADRHDVDQATYEAVKPGSWLEIRYAKQNPQIQDLASHPFGRDRLYFVLVLIGHIALIATGLSMSYNSRKRT